MSERSSKTKLGIGAVSRATGIPAATLRTWERRYGFPEPDRNDAGHRVYETDVVDRLKLTGEVVDAGYRPSNVVGMPSSELEELLEKSGGGATMRAGGERDPSSAAEYESWMADWIDAAEHLDGNRLMQRFRNSWNRLGGLEFLQRRAAPFLRELGEAWEEERLDVVHEHYTSEFLRDFLSSQWRSMSDRSTGPMVVCATPEGELHALGLHLAATVLAMAGWQVVFLGPNTPVADVATAVVGQSPDAVAISISLSFEPERAGAYIGELRDRIDRVDGGVHLLVGGEGAPESEEGVEQFSGLESLYRWAFDRAT